MANKIHEIYKNEIKDIMSSKDVEAIFLVGSSKNIDFETDTNEINDIDLFVFKEINDIQVREIKSIDGIEFDINYFSKKGIDKYLQEKEYFFIKEMSEPKVIYSKQNRYIDIIDLCQEKLKEGPKGLSCDEKIYMKNDINSKLESIKNNKHMSLEEYKFLLNSYLKEIVTGYFIINNKWIPKDKKIFKMLQSENVKLYELINKVYINYSYEDLENVYEYVFKEIKLEKNIKIIH